MSNPTRTLSTRVADLEAGQQEILSILRSMTSTPAPKQVKVKKSPAGGYEVQVAPVSTPPAAQGVPTGACDTCGKTGLLTNTRCAKCRRAAEKAPEAPKKAKAAAKVAPEAPAKATGRRDAKAHCTAPGCGLFVKAGATVCTKHASTSSVRPEGKFLTLEDGKRGYRVPADMVLALRKADLTDEQIIAAAKAKGLGQKVRKGATL